MFAEVFTLNVTEFPGQIAELAVLCIETEGVEAELVKVTVLLFTELKELKHSN